jgi:hypothetical protein
MLVTKIRCEVFTKKTTIIDSVLYLLYRCHSNSIVSTIAEIVEKTRIEIFFVLF